MVTDLSNEVTMTASRSAVALSPLKSAVWRRSRMMVALVFLYIVVAAFYQSVSHPFGYDEDQFFASAFAVAKCGLLPYVDFPYFHMPNLIYGYAPLFLFFSHPFLMARFLTALCGVAIAILVFFVSRSLFPKNSNSVGLAVGLSAAVLITNSPCFKLAVGYVWNHSHSTLCALAAFVFHCRALKRPKPWKYFLLSGLFLGMAIGIRLTFAPLIIPFIAILFLFPKCRTKQKIFEVVVFAIGGLLANALGLYFWINHPSQFWFGNISYAELNTLYRVEMGHQLAMTLGGKLIYLVRDIFSQPSDLLIMLATIFCFLGARILPMFRSIAARPDFLLLIAVIPFLYAGSFAPTPAWPPYFFAPLPFLVLLGPFALAYLQDGEARQARARMLVLAAVVSCFYGSLPKSASAAYALLQPKTWAPVLLHQTATELKAEASVRGGKILTLAPTFAAEAGISVYPPFVVGVFGWRVSHFLTHWERQHYLLPEPAEIESMFAHTLPVVLFSDRVTPASLQQPIREFVLKHKYRPKKLSNGVEVWTPPL
jgi:4-amino-4-deoxy-L-arabinose transferase-like glycosyltransferase